MNQERIYCMTSFEFIAKDQFGQERRGTIEVDSREGAAMKLQRNNLQPLKFIPVRTALAEPRAPLLVLKVDGKESLGGSLGGPAGGGLLAIVLSTAALAMSLGALVAILVRDPLGPGLDKYDFVDT